jgi:GNAT superfamily N-acetyltransferase
MIKLISWNEIFKIWSTELWPNRTSPIETNSAMNFLEGYNIFNMITTSAFFGYIVNDSIVGVNSGHRCADNSYRSRGLWVHPNYRKQGIGQLLLQTTVGQAVEEKTKMIWSYPRKTSWPTYSKVGFKLASEWHASETSESNAFVNLIL